MKDYKYIRAWGMMLHAFPHNIESVVERARCEGAPETAIYRRDDGTWATFEGIKWLEIREAVQGFVLDMER